MRVLLAAFLLAASASAQDAEWVVTFDRALSDREAGRVVAEAGARLAARPGTFEPIEIRATLDAMPPGSMVEDLFASGALSVEVQNVEAFFASRGLGLPSGDVRSVARFAVLATYPSTVPTSEAAARFLAVTGQTPNVTARANELRIVGDRADVARLRSARHVVEVRGAG